MCRIDLYTRISAIFARTISPRDVEMTKDVKLCTDGKERKKGEIAVTKFPKRYRIVY